MPPLRPKDANKRIRRMREVFRARRTQAALQARRARIRRMREAFRHPGGVTPYPHAQRAGNVSAPFSLRGKEKAAGGKKKTPKGDFDVPLWNPLKTTKEEVIPLPWIYLPSKNRKMLQF